MHHFRLTDCAAAIQAMSHTHFKDDTVFDGLLVRVRHLLSSGRGEYRPAHLATVLHALSLHRPHTDELLAAIGDHLVAIADVDEVDDASRVAVVDTIDGSCGVCPGVALPDSLVAVRDRWGP
ncbi:unnamed protein product [Vitrella brassicaformis CCMP3155]|uniref:Uncharacterized protein n=1 Tax=Vitrella brassicaformis (strain CCMP3155) TaxID=1169540 RepID=A0A0G4G1G0_VITBC|nr:unnamed protein product [Vitrella brassicaformis CCMP3155]|eukprot:CEM21689.1 unnamed protein product [Vitrella brassicaformis CCMP3155]